MEAESNAKNEVLSKLTWKIVYTVRDFKNGGYNVYVDNQFTEKKEKDLLQTQKGVFLYFDGQMKRRIDLMDAQGWVSTENKQSSIENIYYHLRSVDDVFKNDSDLLNEAANLVIDDLFSKYHKDTKSFISESLLKENGVHK